MWPQSLKVFYYVHVVSFFGTFGVKLIAQISDVIGDLMAYLLLVNTLPTVAVKEFKGVPLSVWALLVLICSFISSLISVGIDLFEYLQQHLSRLKWRTAVNKEELSRLQFETACLVHRRRRALVFLHIPLVLAEDGFSAWFSLLLLVEFGQRLDSFFFLNLLVSLTILVVMIVSHVSEAVNSHYRLAGLQRVGVHEEIQRLLLEGGEAEEGEGDEGGDGGDLEGGDGEYPLFSRPENAKVLSRCAYIGETFVNETVDCIQDGVSAWQVMRNPQLGSRTLLLFSSSTWAAAVFGVAVYCYVGTVVTQIVIHRRRQVVSYLKGRGGSVLAFLLFPFIFPAAVVAGTIDRERTWGVWRGTEEREGEGKEGNWPLAEREAFISNWSEVLFVTEDLSSMAFNAFIAFGEIRGLYSLQSANFFATLAAFVVRIVIVESRRRKMKHEALIKAKQEVVVRIDNVGLVEEQLHRRELVELRRMTVSLFRSGDIVSFSQNFSEGAIPDLEDLKIEPPSSSAQLGEDESDKEIVEGVCRVLVEGKPLSLRILSLSACQLGDSGCACLVGLFEEGRLPRVSVLRIRSCGIGRGGSECLQKAGWGGVLSGLEELDLRDNGLGGKGGRLSVCVAFHAHGFVQLYSHGLEGGAGGGEVKTEVEKERERLVGRMVWVGKEEGGEREGLDGASVEKFVQGQMESEGFAEFCREEKGGGCLRRLFASLPDSVPRLCLNRNADVIRTRQGGEGWKVLITELLSRLSPGLQEVDVSGSSLSREDLLFLIQVVPPSVQSLKIEGVTKLDLQGWPFLSEGGGKAAGRAFTWLPSSLKVLDVSGYREREVGREGWTCLSERLKGLVGLEELRIDRIALDTSVFRSLIESVPLSVHRVSMEGVTELDLAGWSFLSEKGGKGAERVVGWLPPSLKYLNMSENFGIEESVWSLLAKRMKESEGGLGDLEVFRVSDCGLTTATGGLLFQSLPSASLKRIDFSGNAEIEDVGGWDLLVECVKSEGLNSRLEEVKVSRVNMGRVMLKRLMESIPDLANRVNLEIEGVTHVNFSRWAFLNDQERASRVFSWLPQSLESLNLNECQKVGYTSWTLLGRKMKEGWFVDLKELNLGWCQLHEAKIRDFFPNLPRSLRSIDLRGESRGSATFVFLANRMKEAPLDRLERLYLEESDLDDNGARSLFPALPKSLKYLNLGGCKGMSAIGWGALGQKMKAGGLNGLEEVVIKDCDLNADKLKKFFPFLPKSLKEILMRLNYNRDVFDAARKLRQERPHVNVWVD